MIAALAVAAMSGCAAQPGTRSGGSAPGRPASSDVGRTLGAGPTASALTARVPGCTATAVRTRAALASTAPRLARHPQVFAAASSAAACTLRGRTVVLLAFTSRSHLSEAEAVLHRIDAFYAVGADWVAAPTRVTASAIEESMSQEYAFALHGRMAVGAVS